MDADECEKLTGAILPEDRKWLIDHGWRPPEYLSTFEAAQRLGVHRNTLAKWVIKHEVEPHHLTPGGLARWDYHELSQRYKESR